MDPMTLILISAFLGIGALIFGVGSILHGRQATQAESRLAAFTNNANPTTGQIADDIVRDGLSSASGFVGKLLGRFNNLPMFFQQAESPLNIEQFILLCAGTAAGGGLISILIRSPAALIPVAAICGFGCPWIWMWWRRRSRFKKFEGQLSGALELMARALRSGHSLVSGLNVVASEMPAPISVEFRKVHEEQNLGISIDQALKNLLRRMPNMDLQFFVIAVCIQRQCGGDLAEILNKISGLVRERFKILGQVRALTGEGRISGIVLMALPPALFVAVYYLNPEYVMILFEREEGRKMLFATGFMQVLGAICIKKIIDIKV
ncbi:MAG: type II secretion system F family protein [Fuerstiella sp.]|jgi:tight adherence protein B|nr:type II secretion system F family protein [Fuerstiella sp.]